MIKIRTEKFLKGCRQMRRVLALEGALTEDELPAEYLNGTPRVVYDRETQTLRLESLFIPDLRVGLEYTEEEFQKALQYVREAGQRLHDINEKRRETLKTWTGEETFLV